MLNKKFLHQKEKQQYRDQSCDSSDLISQTSHSSNLNPDSIGKENKLYQVMQENLRQQKLLRPQTPRHLPQASFNGPFFTLEEIHTKQQRSNLKYTKILNIKYAKFFVSIIIMITVVKIFLNRQRIFLPESYLYILITATQCCFAKFPSVFVNFKSY